MKRIVVLLGIVFMGAILFSCAPKVETITPAGERPSEIAIPLTKTGWEEEWAETLKAAQKEGKVVVYGDPVAVALREVALKLIKDKFSFDLEVTVMKGAESAGKISSERRAGLYIPDVYVSGPSTIFTVFMPQGWVDKVKPLLILPEVVDPNAWYGGEHPWVDKDRSRLFIMFNNPNIQIGINTNLVKPREITSFQDLLDPMWRDKILINDPTKAGTASQSFGTLLYHKALNSHYFRELIKQNPTVIRDERLQMDWLARGKFPVVLWPSDSRFYSFEVVGAPIGVIAPKEGVVRSAGGGGLLVMDRAPHPNAAKILVNWLLSKEGQYLIQGATGKRSARIDIPVDNVLPRVAVPPEVKLLMEPSLFDEEFRLSGNDKIEELAKEIFAPLLK